MIATVISKEPNENIIVNTVATLNEFDMVMIYKVTIKIAK